MVAALLVTAATFAVAWWAFERHAQPSLARRVGPYVRARVPEQTDTFRRLQPLARTEAQLSRLPGWARFASLAERSYPGVAVTRVFWAACAAEVAFALLAAILWSTPIAALVGAVLGAFAVRAWLAVRVQRRRRAFDDQLPELLGEIAAALRAGHGFNQALQAVAADAAEPARSELQRVIGEAQLGRPMEEALTALGRRIRSADLDFVLDAVIVQRQVGGSLAGIVALVGDAVRQRHQYAMRLRSITATGRLSATVLLALPLALGLFLTLLHHAYFAPLLHTGMGRAFVAVAAVMYAAGALWLRRITAVPGAPE